MHETESPGRTNLLSLTFAAILLVAFALMISSFPLGIFDVFFGHLSSSGLGPTTPVYSFQMDVALSSIAVPVGSNLGSLFLWAWSLQLLFFGIATLQRPSFISGIRKISRSGPSAAMANPFTGTVIVLGLVMLATMVIDSIQNAVGIPTGNITGDAFSLLVSLTLAPLVEELGFRFVIIGIPVFLLLLLTRAPARRLLVTLWRPSRAWTGSANDHAVEGLSAMARPLAFLLLLLSSIVFGLAHYFSGAGWQAGKVSEAAVAGIGLGYLYVRYGFHAGVLAHWGVNYFSTVFAFAGQAVWGIPWDTSSANIFNTGPVFVTAVLVGVPAAYVYGLRALRRVIKPVDEMRADGSHR